ncbi:MAG: hypothetical protein K1X47_05400 [Cyclobacteriaceae bacterium]|nr:hypothetical protein [Cyclobacteriaceae bacterium]
MRNVCTACLFSGLLLLAACQGKLSDEQRRQIKEGLKSIEVQKVPEAKLLDGAYALGRSLSKTIEARDKYLGDARFLDSISQATGVKVVKLTPDVATLQSIEKQIIEAYVAGTNQVELTDNIQKIGTDTILYTKPYVFDRPDGSLVFSHAMGLRIPVKSIIRSFQE